MQVGSVHLRPLAFLAVFVGLWSNKSWPESVLLVGVCALNRAFQAVLFPSLHIASSNRCQSKGLGYAGESQVQEGSISTQPQVIICLPDNGEKPFGSAYYEWPKLSGSDSNCHSITLMKMLVSVWVHHICTEIFNNWHWRFSHYKTFSLMLPLVRNFGTRPDLSKPGVQSAVTHHVVFKDSSLDACWHACRYISCRLNISRSTWHRVTEEP